MRMFRYLVVCVGLLGCGNQSPPAPPLPEWDRSPYIKTTVHYEMICNEDISDPSKAGDETMIIVRKAKGDYLYLFVPAKEVEYLDKVCAKAKSKKIRRFGEK